MRRRGRIRKHPAGFAEIWPDQPAGQLALEEKTMPINERDECDRHLEDAGELRDDTIEGRLGFGIEQLELGERGKPSPPRRRVWAPGVISSVSSGAVLADLVQRFGKRDDHLIGAGIAQTPSRLGYIFRRTPESNDDFHLWKSGAHFFAQISRVNDRRRRYNRDADDIDVRLFHQTE